MKYLVIITCVFLPAGVFAQLKMLLHENFTDNHLGWYEADDENYSMQVKNGYYEITTPGRAGMTYISPPIDLQKDFSFEANFIQSDGDSNGGFGFIWGYDEVSDRSNNFLVSTEGYLNVITSDETRKDEKAWTKIESVKPIGKINHLKFTQQQDVLKFYVNGSEVLSLKALPWYGKTVGFLCKANMRLQIDNFIIHSDLDINLPLDMPTGLIKENLGTAINTEYDEVSPKISVDGKTIFFTRKKNPANVGGMEDDSDIWYSTSADGVHWSESKNIGAPVNTEAINSIVSISQDNNTMLVAAQNDFNVFDRTAIGWKYSGVLGVQYENENPYFEACQSANGKAVLFAARTKASLFYEDNLNERDIFVSRKRDDGTWGALVNLGAVINTRRNEMSPFLAADGRTLYFASDGHPGYGELDIFMSKRLDDSWTNWSEPINLGPEINTFGFDAYYTVPASGDVAYMCTSERSFGRFDLVRIRLPEPVKPDPVVLVLGKVLHAKTKKPIQAGIVFENIATGKEAGEAVSNAMTGEYRIALPYGLSYGLRAQAKGFLSVNENLELTDLHDYSEVRKDLFLVPLEVGEAIQLNNVFFEQGRPVLKPESYLELDRLVIILKENPTIEIELSGHSDNIGNRNSLIVLSMDRVGAVKNYLVEKGIQPNRISGKGFGAARPIVKNDTEEHRGMNRRVEFKIVKK